MWLSGISSLPFLEAPELSAAHRTVGMKGTKAVLTESNLVAGNVDGTSPAS